MGFFYFKENRRDKWKFAEAAKIVGVLLSAPLNHIGTTIHERVYIGVCLLFSLNISGAFQVRIKFS